MGIFKRKDEVKLFEYIDDIAAKVACTYVSLLVPNEIIKDTDLRQLANDKARCAAVVFAVCCRQLSKVSERKKEVVVPILMSRTIHHLANEIFADSNSEANEQKTEKALSEYFATYYPLSTDVFRLFGALSAELAIKAPSGNPLTDTMLITQTLTGYITKFGINNFSKSVSKLL